MTYVIYLLGGGQVQGADHRGAEADAGQAQDPSGTKDQSGALTLAG